MMAGLAGEKVLPALISVRTKENVPILAVIFISLLQAAVLYLTHLGYLNVEKLVAFANGFFVINVSLGIAAGIILINNLFIKICGWLLGFIFIGMLFCFAPKISLLIICLLAMYYVYKQREFNRSSIPKRITANGR